MFVVDCFDCSVVTFSLFHANALDILEFTKVHLNVHFNLFTYTIYFTYTHSIFLTLNIPIYINLRTILIHSIYIHTLQFTYLHNYTLIYPKIHNSLLLSRDQIVTNSLRFLFFLYVIFSYENSATYEHFWFFQVLKLCRPLKHKDMFYIFENL